MLLWPGLGRMEATFLSPWEARPPCTGAVLVLKTCMAQTFSSQHAAQHRAAGHRCRTSPTKQCVLSHPSREPKDSGLLTKENRAGFLLLPSELLPAGLLALWPLLHPPLPGKGFALKAETDPSTRSSLGAAGLSREKGALLWGGWGGGGMAPRHLGGTGTTFSCIRSFPSQLWRLLASLTAGYVS